MKHLLILGAGTAGTIMSNHLAKRLDGGKWKITVVDQDRTHYYQPGFLFLPFGLYSEKDVMKPKCSPRTSCITSRTSRCALNSTATPTASSSRAAAGGFLLDFNYDLEPVPGKFPVPALGPFALLGESRLNHFGKLAFEWVSWHLLLKGLPLPLVEHKMSLAGKEIPPGPLKPQPAV